MNGKGEKTLICLTLLNEIVKALVKPFASAVVF